MVKSLNAKYLPAVDELRTVAALLVLSFHLTVTYYLILGPEWIKVWNPLKLFVVEGHLGVSLFFVLSGFIFTWVTYNKEKLHLREFYLNRFLRIYPLFILMVLLTISAKRNEFDFMYFLAFMFGFSNYGDPPFANAFNSVLWTIGVELQFYMLFPWLLRLLKQRGMEALMGIVVVLTIFRAVVYGLHLNINDFIYWTLPGRLDQFLIGMLLAYVFINRARFSVFQHLERRRYRLLLFVASLVTLYAAIWSYNHIGGGRPGGNVYKVIWPTIDGLAWAGFAGAYILNDFRSWFTWILRQIGQVSYSVYLTHWPIMTVLGLHGLLIHTRLPDFYDALLMIVLVFAPAVVAVSAITYRYIEEPFLNMRKKY